jgi:hypothetical protein
MVGKDCIIGGGKGAVNEGFKEVSRAKNTSRHRQPG